MYILIVGCGRLGSELALTLAKTDHDVSVVDRHSENLDILGSGFNGSRLRGVEIDTDVLIEAGIKDAELFLALTPDDNINLMACQIAKKLFNVPTVLARICNPERAYIYETLGVEGISPNSLWINLVKEKYLCVQ